MCGRRNLRRRSRAATSARSWRGWITSSRGGASLKDARTRAISAWRCRPAPRSSTRRRREPPAAMPPFSPNGRAAARQPQGRDRGDRRLTGAGAGSGARRHRRAVRGSQSCAAARRWISSSIASARPSAAGTNYFRARLRRKAGSTENSAMSRRGCRIWRKWVSMCCIFRPSIPSAASTARARTIALRAKPGDVGSPWAIGSAEGGHKDILPQLGTFDDFDRLLNVARALGIEIAMDIAFQCAPDHPYVTRTSAMVQASARRQRAIRRESAEEIPGHLSVRFRNQRLARLWNELKSIVDFWIARGVRIFRVDNPHTKAFAFWEWLISATKRDHPDVIYLAEAFTRPKVMHRLAKLGFSQSYTYFTWRNTKQELTDYFTELTLRSGPPVLPAQRVAQHARHPARDAAVGLAAHVCGKTDSCRDSVGELRHLRSDLRADGKRAARSRAARSIAIRRNISCGTGPCSSPTASGR